MASDDARKKKKIDADKSAQKKRYYTQQRERAEKSGDQKTVDKIYGKLNTAKYGKTSGVDPTAKFYENTPIVTKDKGERLRRQAAKGASYGQDALAGAVASGQGVPFGKLGDALGSMIGRLGGRGMLMDDDVARSSELAKPMKMDDGVARAADASKMKVAPARARVVSSSSKPAASKALGARKAISSTARKALPAPKEAAKSAARTATRAAGRTATRRAMGNDDSDPPDIRREIKHARKNRKKAGSK